MQYMASNPSSHYLYVKDYMMETSCWLGVGSMIIGDTMTATKVE